MQSTAKNLQAHFYLALCYLKKYDQGTFHLQRIIELKGEFLFEKCYWYLGNAYLLKEDGKKALEMFEKVVKFEGDFEWEAREVILKRSKVNTKN